MGGECTESIMNLAVSKLLRMLGKMYCTGRPVTAANLNLLYPRRLFVIYKYQDLDDRQSSSVKNELVRNHDEQEY